MDTMNKREQKFWSNTRIGQGCWLWTGGHKEDGYGRFYEGMINKKRTYAKAHRVAWELTKGPLPAGSVVRHTCDTFDCVRPGHLTTATLLAANDVLEIRARLEEGESCKLLAEDYSISLNSVYDIRKRRTWKHV
jgi:hypothetical protein